MDFECEGEVHCRDKISCIFVSLSVEMSVVFSFRTALWFQGCMLREIADCSRLAFVWVNLIQLHYTGNTVFNKDVSPL